MENFTPKIGQRYWYIAGEKKPVMMWDVNYGRFIDFFRRQCGNCYRVRSDAKLSLEKIIIEYKTMDLKG